MTAHNLTREEIAWAMSVDGTQQGAAFALGVHRDTIARARAQHGIACERPPRFSTKYEAHMRQDLHRIRRALRRRRRQREGRSRPPELLDARFLRAKYIGEGMTIRQLGILLGVRGSRVSDYLQKAGIRKTRGRYGA